MKEEILHKSIRSRLLQRKAAVHNGKGREKQALLSLDTGAEHTLETQEHQEAERWWEVWIPSSCLVYRLATFSVSNALHQLCLFSEVGTKVQGSSLQRKKNQNLVKDLTEEKQRLSRLSVMIRRVAWQGKRQCTASTLKSNQRKRNQ